MVLRMPRPQPALLALALLCTAVPLAHAQLGGLVKKKAVEKVTGKKDTVAVAGAKEKCDASSIVITTDVVDRYLKGMVAREAMMQKLAKEPGPTGGYYAAWLKRRAIQDRKDIYDLHRGPDWEKHQALYKRVMAGDSTAFKPYAAFSETINPNKVEIPELEWEAHKKGNARMDSTLKVAGGFSDCDWLWLSERLPRIVGVMAGDQEDKEKDYTGSGSAKEVAAVKTRFPELARGLGYKIVSPEDKARLKKEEDDAKAAAAAGPSTGNAQLDCFARAQGEWMKSHKAEMDKASDSKDMGLVMKLSQEMNMEAMAKCPSQ